MSWGLHVSFFCKKRVWHGLGNNAFLAKIWHRQLYATWQNLPSQENNLTRVWQFFSCKKMMQINVTRMQLLCTRNNLTRVSRQLFSCRMMMQIFPTWTHHFCKKQTQKGLAILSLKKKWHEYLLPGHIMFLHQKLIWQGLGNCFLAI